MVLHDASWFIRECSEGTMLEPCLLKPCFLVAGLLTIGRLGVTPRGMPVGAVRDVRKCLSSKQITSMARICSIQQIQFNESGIESMSTNTSA